MTKASSLPQTPWHTQARQWFSLRLAASPGEEHWLRHCRMSAGSMTAQNRQAHLTKVSKLLQELPAVASVHPQRQSKLDKPVNFIIKRDTPKAQCWDLARSEITLTMIMKLETILWKFVADKELGNGHWSGVSQQGLACKAVKLHFILKVIN